MICKCYHEEKNFLGKVGVCWGTQERDACSCGGDKSKCDFYPNLSVAVEKPLTNYDRVISKSPEELADLIFFELAQFLDRDSLLAWLKEEVKSDA